MPNALGLLIVFCLFAPMFAASFFGDRPSRKAAVASEKDFELERPAVPGAQPDVLIGDPDAPWVVGTVIAF